MMFGKDKTRQNQPDQPDQPEGGRSRGGECCGGQCGGEPSGSEYDPVEAATQAEAEILRLRQQVEELNTKYLRTVADYQNSARRSVKDSEEARHQGAKSVVLNVLPVLDHFDLALSQDVDKASAEQIVGGVKVIRDELMKVLQNHGVSIVAPKTNEVFDPNRHHAVTQQDAEGVEPGRVVATLQAGYTLGDRVVRPAMVSVKPSQD
jgi:molecular chaperone GrpE